MTMMSYDDALALANVCVHGGRGIHRCFFSISLSFSFSWCAGGGKEGRRFFLVVCVCIQDFLTKHKLSRYTCMPSAHTAYSTRLKTA